MTRTLCLLALFATPALAQETVANLDPLHTGAPAAVAQLAFAHALYSHALFGKDPATMLTAAKLAGAVDVMDAARSPNTTGTAAPSQPSAHDSPVTPTQMLATTRAMVAQDDTLIALLAEAETAISLIRTGSVTATARTLPAGQTDTWTLPFDGGTLAEVGIVGDADGNLDLTITDANGAALCIERSPQDSMAYAFAPAETGYFTITVQNRGPGLNSYLLLTN